MKIIMHKLHYYMLDAFNIKEKYNCCLEIPEFYYKGIQRLFEETRLNLPIDLRETLIFERLFLLLFNAAIFGYTI